MAEQGEQILQFKKSDDWMDDERPAFTIYSSGQWSGVSWQVRPGSEGSGLQHGPYVNFQMNARDRSGMTYVWQDMRLEKENQFDVLLSALETARKEWKEATDGWLEQHSDNSGS
jgi:hypothetical protein